MKKIIFTLLGLIVLALPAQGQRSGPQRLQVEGNRLQTEDGRPVTLRGVSLCSLSWHNPISLLRSLNNPKSDWKVNVVRLPVQPEEWDRLGPDAYIRERLDPAVAECKKKKIYCVIDWHEIADWDEANTERKLKNFWRIIAPRYANEPLILYEIFNEPIGPQEREKKNWLIYRAKAQKWIDMIRQVAPETVLLVGSPHWSQMPAFAKEDPLKGNNLVYVLHLYHGWKRESWDDLFGNASLKIPLFISEWGWSSKVQNLGQPFYGTLDEYAIPLKDYLEARPHISWTAWSYDPECGPAMLGKDKEMGDFVRSWLKIPPPRKREGERVGG